MTLFYFFLPFLSASFAVQHVHGDVAEDESSRSSKRRERDAKRAKNHFAGCREYDQQYSYGNASSHGRAALLSGCFASSNDEIGGHYRNWIDNKE